MNVLLGTAQARTGVQTDTATATSVALRQLFVHGTDVHRASTPVLVPEVTSLSVTIADTKPFISSGQDCAIKTAF